LKICFWFELVPHQDIRYEGIGRHAANLMNVLLHENHNVVIAAPIFSKNIIEQFLIEYDLMKFFGKNLQCNYSSKKQSIFFNYIESKVNKVVKPSNKINSHHAKSRIKKGLKYVLSLLNANLRLLLLLPVILLLAIPFVIAIFFYIFVKIIKKISRLILQKFKFKTRLYNILKLDMVFHFLVKNEFIKQAKNINRLENIDFIYIPYPGWSYASNIDKPRVVSVPDVVFLEFPVTSSRMFGSENVKFVFNNIKQSLESATAAISHSQYVLSRHVIDWMKFPEEDAYFVHHGAMTIHQHLRNTQTNTNLCQLEKAYLIINKYIADKVKTSQTHYENIINKYLQNIAIDKIEYVFIASQVRPYKNIICVCKAIDEYNKRFNKHLKLFITGDIQSNSDLISYIKAQGLELTCLSVCKLKPDEHAAFFAAAKFAITSSYFEGGFPFTFFEALSVNTPVLMSAIPVTLEFLNEEQIKAFTFDPRSVSELIDRIYYVMNNHNALLEMQRKLYDQLSKRTWHDAGLDYINVFQTIIDKKNLTHEK